MTFAFLYFLHKSASGKKDFAKINRVVGFYRIEFVIDCSLLMLVLSVGKISRDEYIELDLLKTILRTFHFSQTLSLGSLKWAGNFKTDRRIMLIIGKVGLNSLQKGIYEVLSVRGTHFDFFHTRFSCLFTPHAVFIFYSCIFVLSKAIIALRAHLFFNF